MNFLLVFNLLFRVFLGGIFFKITSLQAGEVIQGGLIDEQTADPFSPQRIYHDSLKNPPRIKNKRGIERELCYKRKRLRIEQTEKEFTPAEPKKYTLPPFVDLTKIPGSTTPCGWHSTVLSFLSWIRWAGNHKTT